MIIPRKKTILIADDEPAIRRGLERLFDADGYTTTLVANGQEALDAASAQAFEIALLDIGMPGLSGMDVLREMSTLYPDTAVIMVTAVDDVKIGVEAMNMGASDYIVKPVDVDDLLVRVEKALDKRELELLKQRHEQILRERLREQQTRLESQFAQLINSIAREHSLILERESSKGRGGDLSALPPELQQQKVSIEEFAQALLKVIRSGSLTASSESPSQPRA